MAVADAFLVKASFVVSGDGLLVAFDEKLTQRFAMGEGELLPSIHVNDRILWLSFLADLRNDKVPLTLSIRLQAQDNRAFYDVTLGFLQKTAQGFLLSLAYQDAENALNVKPLHAVAHEMRTPLNAIIGFSDMILHLEKQGGKVSDYAMTIRQAGFHLLGVVEAMLQNPTMKQQKLISDVVTVMQECLAMLAPLKAQRVITLLHDEMALWAEIDEISLRQIGFNLIANAIKFTDEEGAITVIVERLENGRIGLAVSDNGIGMHEDELQKITRPFERGQDVKKRHIHGNGLGLCLVHELVERHQGTLHFESRWQEGTTVSLGFAAAQQEKIENSNNPAVVNMPPVLITKIENTNENTNEKTNEQKETRLSA